MNKLSKRLKQLLKGKIREEMKKEGVLNRFKSRTHKSKKIYDRKNKDWKDEV